MFSSDVKFMSSVVIVLVVSLITIFSVLILPMRYFEGKANSVWVEQRFGIEIPWYHAAGLDLQIHDVYGVEVNVNGQRVPGGSIGIIGESNVE